ncbi:hypothetical protein EVAR_100026_1 [Eumeta japonica]|uniref:Uncharacterized protein n=1 Tax=Eumeta variegata TaxID=151549 RepID=A0A4C1ZQF6_EUMVA|nr:hypothetical protein EVAR_100026_1 [Eumeta japonica]
MDVGGCAAAVTSRPPAHKSAQHSAGRGRERPEASRVRSLPPRKKLIYLANGCTVSITLGSQIIINRPDIDIALAKGAKEWEVSKHFNASTQTTVPYS